MLTPIDVVDVPHACPECKAELYALATPSMTGGSTYGAPPQLPCALVNGRLKLSGTWAVDLKCVGCNWSLQMEATDG